MARLDSKGFENASVSFQQRIPLSFIHARVSIYIPCPSLILPLPFYPFSFIRIGIIRRRNKNAFAGRRIMAAWLTPLAYRKTILKTANNMMEARNGGDEGGTGLFPL